MKNKSSLSLKKPATGQHSNQDGTMLLLLLLLLLLLGVFCHRFPPEQCTHLIIFRKIHLNIIIFVTINIALLILINILHKFHVVLSTKYFQTKIQMHTT